MFDAAVRYMGDIAQLWLTNYFIDKGFTCRTYDS